MYLIIGIVAILLIVWYYRPRKDPSQKLLARARDLQTRGEQVSVIIAARASEVDRKQAEILPGLSTTHQKQVEMAAVRASLIESRETIEIILATLAKLERSLTIELASANFSQIKRMLREQSRALMDLLMKEYEIIVGPPPSAAIPAV